MMKYVIERASSDELKHFGIKGQKWGVRRFENPDGTLTEEGKKRYNVDRGGNDKYRKRFVKDVKQFKKLNDRADIGLQAQKSAQYRSKSDISKFIGLASGAIGAGGLFDSKVTIPKMMWNRFAPKWSALDVSMAGPARSVWMRGQNEARRALYEKKIAKITEPLKTASIVVGVAGLFGGLATSKVYSSLAKAAEQRTTDLGHKQAVADAKKHVDRMMNMYADTPYSDLVSQLYGELKHHGIKGQKWGKGDFRTQMVL